MQIKDRIPLGNRKNRKIKMNLDGITSFDQFKILNDSDGIFHDSEPNNITEGADVGVYEIGTPTNRALLGLPLADAYTTTGSANAYEITAPEITELRDGMRFYVRFHVANTSATVNLNINALGSLQIYRYGTTSLYAGDIQANSIWHLEYNNNRLSLIGAPIIPLNHATTANTYGLGDTSNYGHVKATAGNGLSISNGTIAMAAASTSVAGTVQLANTTGNSQSLAASQYLINNVYNELSNTISTQAGRFIWIVDTTTTISSAVQVNLNLGRSINQFREINIIVTGSLFSQPSQSLVRFNGLTEYYGSIALASNYVNSLMSNGIYWSTSASPSDYDFHTLQMKITPSVHANQAYHRSGILVDLLSITSNGGVSYPHYRDSVAGIFRLGNEINIASINQVNFTNLNNYTIRGGARIVAWGVLI